MLSHPSIIFFKWERGRKRYQYGWVTVAAHTMQSLMVDSKLSTNMAQPTNKAFLSSKGG
jgi:hypothetical protein